ncbi:MAG: TonB-dependent receptor [Woeseia sp.]
MYSKSLQGRLVAAALGFLFFLLNSLSVAETLDEITVVADFRERKAAELPPSISVLDRATIEQSAVQHFEELIQGLPNLNWSGDGHRARYLQIRGVGELEQYEGAPNPSVGFLIDDIDFSGMATIATLFDVQQIDVLRGPQGTRYGANALAGLVYVQSAEPTEERSGRLQLSAGDDDMLSAGVAFGGPVASDKLHYRFAAQHHTSNGFRDNAYLQRDDTNGRNESAVRGKLEWLLSDDWTVRLSTLFSDIDDGYDAFAIDNSLTMQSDNPGKDAQRSVGAAIRSEWSGSDRVSFTSITSMADSDAIYSFDSDWGNDDVWAPYTYDYESFSERQRKTISQEFRLASGADGRLFNDSSDWLLGAYVMRLDEKLTTRNVGDYADPFFDFTLALDDSYTGRFEAVTAALFGELDIDIGEAGMLTVGLRGERRSTDYNDSANLNLGPSESMLGGELRYRHDFSERTSGFAGLSKGYKAGGFNLGAVPADRREFSGEQLWAAELGMRSRVLNDALSISAVLFYNKRVDQQVRTSFQLVPNDPTSFIFYTDNAASGRTLGLEAELNFQASESVELYLNAGLMRAEFDQFETPQVILSGRDQAHAPRYTLAAGGLWQHPSGWFARLDATARDEFYFDVSHDQKSAAHELLNVRIGFNAERWSLQLWARNLTDETYAVRGFYFGNEPPDFPETLYIRQGDPRHAGITFDMRF